MDLSGKVAVITGASRGLGAGIARVAHECGMALLLGSRSAAELPDGPRVHSMRVDVADAQASDAMAREALARFGQVDLWINNAGLLEPVGPLRELDTAALRTLLEVNVLGVAHGSRAFARLRRAQPRSAERGVLLNISSGAARKAYHGWAGYCASKAAVDRLSEVVALEEAQYLRVHAVAPGVIETGMQEIIRAKDEAIFRDVARFRQLHESGALSTPQAAGERLLRLAFDPRAQRDTVCIDLRDAS